ncbi:hypothetical protein NLX83_03390 [Allokutzneria sp. A3M-2-11 16]|uniref:hypothetical protein n=1 Tax=Allokutzneria sp. A3M-2-11 16 TaxID=2962043 RepID=UPI0020B763A4|nr:hypothetical protein [Allokutzneria sp. A3M-2-11 16]MCP3798294.1 hypothetical protein [Allokutzneria sp. A3M-2-11 16]
MFASTPLHHASQRGNAVSEQSAGRIMLGVAAVLFGVSVLQSMLSPVLWLPGISHHSAFGFLAVLWAPLVTSGLGSLVVALAWTVPIGFLALRHLGVRHVAVITAVSWVVGGLALWMNASHLVYSGPYVVVAGWLGVLIARRCFGTDKDGGTTATWLFLLFALTLFFQTHASVSGVAAHAIAAAAACGASWLVTTGGIRVRP